MDAAASVGVHFTAMSAHLRGKTRTVHGKRYMYLSRVSEGLDAIVTRLRETAAVEADAKKWQAYQAEQEAIRKAEERRLEEERKARERHEAAVAKARAKVEKLTDNCNKLESKLLEEERALMEAEIELENLLGEEAQQVA
jgi:chromosome segregation ATPase